MALSNTEETVRQNLGLTEEEFIAAKVGVPPEAYRAKTRAASLTEEQLKAAKGASMTPEAYAARLLEIEARGD